MTDHREPDDAPSIVAFDIGEVLIDETRVWSVWADLIGVSPLTFAAVLGAAISQGAEHPEVFEHLAPNLEWSRFEAEHEARYGGFRETDLYPDVRTCLAELRSDGFTVVLAGNQPAHRRAQLEELALPVDHIATSEELGHEKPSAGFFTAMLEAIGVDDPGACLYVGDRVDNDVLPAQRFGLATCWLRRGPWGQLQELPDEGQAPDIVLEGLGELPVLLRTWRGAADDHG